jgi:TatD DNase family protein
MFIDTHAHLTKEEYGNDLEEVISRALGSKVTKIVNASFDFQSALEGIKLSEKYPFIYPSIGIHPHHADTVNDLMIEEIKKVLTNNKKIVAFGEIGLDYYQNPIDKKVQQEAFRKLLGLAQDFNLPVIFHSREATEDMVKVIKEANRGKLKGVFHCFNQDEKLWEFAKEQKFLISFTGTITFKKADKTREFIKTVPLESIMIETDCPYLAPEPFRGKRNEPSYVKYIAERMAQIRNITVEEVAKVTTKNAEEFFQI